MNSDQNDRPGFITDVGRLNEIIVHLVRCYLPPADCTDSLHKEALAHVWALDGVKEEREQLERELVDEATRAATEEAKTIKVVHAVFSHQADRS